MLTASTPNPYTEKSAPRAASVPRERGHTPGVSQAFRPPPLQGVACVARTRRRVRRAPASASPLHPLPAWSRAGSVCGDAAAVRRTAESLRRWTQSWSAVSWASAAPPFGAVLHEVLVSWRARRADRRGRRRAAVAVVGEPLDAVSILHKALDRQAWWPEGDEPRQVEWQRHQEALVEVLDEETDQAVRMTYEGPRSLAATRNEPPHRSGRPRSS